MKIENPFESGHIKNYILAYVGVVVIMVLFFIASTLWNEPKEHPKKEFAVEKKADFSREREEKEPPKEEHKQSKIKLMEVHY